MTRTGSILIVDDEVSIRQTLARILQRNGLEATTAESGEQALAFLETTRYDLVYLDIRMPGLTGLDALDAIHARQPEIPVILFTAQPDIHSAVEALRRGAVDYLLKPLKPDAFIAKTQQVLAAQKKEKRKREIQEQISNLQEELDSLTGEEPIDKRPQTVAPPTERFLKRGALVLDLHARRLTIGEEVINLQPTSFNYLLVLARHAPEVVEYRTLVAEAQGYETDMREAQELVKWHIHHIRSAIEKDARQPTYLFNIRGVGYRLVTD
jgi:DNA-binding response OmpR family regulator